MKKDLPVAMIENGTVIDHIPPGQALILIRLMRLEGERISVGINLKSPSMGRKDLIKVEGRFFSEKESQQIAVFAPRATICIIERRKVKRKFKAELPPVIERLLVCPNVKCITRCEPVATRFAVEEFHRKVHLRCEYCQRRFERDQFDA